MSGEPIRERLGYWREASHKIGVNMHGVVCRDGYAVKVTRVSDNVIRVGCTEVSIEALERLLVLSKGSSILQDGAE